MQKKRNPVLASSIKLQKNPARYEKPMEAPAAKKQKVARALLGAVGTAAPSVTFLKQGLASPATTAALSPAMI